MIRQFKSKPLPYTMGNAGDLIKHGLLSELINWLPVKQQEPITFYDPFGGRPWQTPITNEVARRLESLQPCPLKSSQIDAKERYFGSGHLIRNLSGINHKKIDIYSSDRDKNARYDLKMTGLNLIHFEEFNPDSAYSILDCPQIKENNSIVLIDPFYDLPYITDVILKKIIKLVSKNPIAIILYVLYLDEEIGLWEQFQVSNRKRLNKQISYHSLTCRAIMDSPISGEGKFHSSISLYLNQSLLGNKVGELTSSLKKFKKNIESTLNTTINYSNR